jgi:hypothetical protein
MQFSPTGAAAQPASPFRHAQRRLYRHPLYSLVYVTIDRDNGGILRDLSEDGAAVQAVGALRVGEPVRMRFDLMAAKHSPGKVRVDVTGQVAWANASGQAGVKFVDLSSEIRRQVNEWIFGNLISSIAYAPPILGAPDVAEDENLVLSEDACAPIRVRHVGRLPEDAAADDVPILDWLLGRFSPHALSLAVDGMVLCVAVLLFFVVVLIVAKALPSWHVTLALLGGVAGFFTLLYWYLFRSLVTGTAGRWLTDIAMREVQAERGPRQDEVRFR